MDDNKKILFQKFINDECNPEEIEELFQYLQKSKEDGVYKALMDEVWLKLKKYPLISQVDKAKQFEIILDRIGKNNDTKVRPLFRQYGVQMAATFIGFLVISALIYLQFFNSSLVTYQTKYGETMGITLPDGSKVMLNNNSRLSYNEDWREQGTRKVSLEGEAFFSVVHTEDDQQFIVRTTDHVSIEVLGTRFNVNNRRNTTEVVLNAGKVKVNIKGEDKKQEVLMEPGELVAYSQITQQYQKKLINTKTYTSWKDSVLIFEEQSLQEIALTLEDNYGYSFHFANEKISKYKFTGTIPTNKLNALFTMLSKSFDLKIDIKDKNIWVKPNK